MEKRLLFHEQEHQTWSNSDARPSLLDRLLQSPLSSAIGNTHSFIFNVERQAQLRHARTLTPEQRGELYRKMNLERYTPEHRKKLLSDDQERLLDIEQRLKDYESSSTHTESDMLQMSHDHAQSTGEALQQLSGTRELGGGVFGSSGLFLGFWKLLRMFLGFSPAINAASNYYLKTKELLAAEGIVITDSRRDVRSDAYGHATAFNQLFRQQSRYRTLPEYVRGLATFIKERGRTTLTFKECLHHAQVWTKEEATRSPL